MTERRMIKRAQPAPAMIPAEYSPAIFGARIPGNGSMCVTTNDGTSSNFCKINKVSINDVTFIFCC